MASTTSRVPRHCFSKKHAALLAALVHADSKQRVALLRSADSSFVRCICECVLNVLHGVVPLQEHSKKKLRKHASVLRRLVNEREGLHKKKKVLIQKGGAFLPALLVPLLAEFASRLLHSSSS